MLASRCGDLGLQVVDVRALLEVGPHRRRVGDRQHRDDQHQDRGAAGEPRPARLASRRGGRGRPAPRGRAARVAPLARAGAAAAGRRRGGVRRLGHGHVASVAQARYRGKAAAPA